MSSRKYDIIYADPPWRFNSWSKKGMRRSADKHYQTQDIGFLKTMCIKELSNPDCVLLMWATFPCLEHALKLGRMWGFTYKTVAFTWIKTNKGNGKLFMGMGYYTRANAEIVLLFTKGRPLPRVSKKVPQVVMLPRSRHSEKPHVIREHIVTLFGDRCRLELFARDKAGFDDLFSGWDVFGNEVNHSIGINLKRPGDEN